MSTNKLFTFKSEITKDNFEEVMQQAIALELATIPTYLSTYYSINRAQDQDTLYSKLHTQLTAANNRAATKKTSAEIDALAEELKKDVLVYANKSAALVMSVVIEEMLHLALSSNVKQAVCQVAPDLMGIGKVLSFPTQLDGHIPEFEIDAAKLSLKQLTTFLKIESPKEFTNPTKDEQLDGTIDYVTIGAMYRDIIDFINANYPGPYKQRPQLLPPEPTSRKRPFYSQNSVNTVYYDREHNPKFASDEDSGQLIGVYNSATAVDAINEIVEQGEGNVKKDGEERAQHLLEFLPNGLAKPMDVSADGTVSFLPGDYDDDPDSDKGKELSHFAKFLEAYSLGDFYEKKFAGIEGLDDFFTYFVYDQDTNPTQADYDASGNKALALANKLGSALFAYLLLMVETCYYKDDSTQYDIFMFGVHKAMIWLLSGVGNKINVYTYTKDNQAYNGALSFEPYDFEQSYQRPKAQIMNLIGELAAEDPTNWGWAIESEYVNYYPALPDIGLDHDVVEGVPAVPSTPFSK